MSRTHRWIEARLEELSYETGYDPAFLAERLEEVMEEDGDWDYFVGVTMEGDW